MTNEVQQWENPVEFLMTLTGFAVGIGGVIRFPYLCFTNGGSAYVIAFLTVLFFFGVPLFFLELTIAQYSKLGADKVWRVIPIFKGLGLSSVLITLFFCIYFNVLISYSVIYIIASFFPTLPWTTCDNWWNDEKCFPIGQSSSVLNMTMNVSNITRESASKQFFNNFVLEISDGIDFPDGFNYKVVVALAFCWILAYLSLIKGIQSLGKVSYFTAIFPYVMITVLIIRGVTLPGAFVGLEYYTMRLDLSKLFAFKTWIDAASQALFCLGIAQGGLFTLGRHNRFSYNHQGAACFISIIDGFTGIYAGFAIFSVLGFMAVSTNQEIEDLAVGGLGLSYIVYPEALALMPFPWIWCVFFFMMMMTIGFGSLLSMAECCLDTLSSMLNIQPKYSKLVRFITCFIFFLSGLPMSTKGGYYLVNLIDSYVCTLPLLIVASLEVIGLGWIYGVEEIRKNIRLMLDIDLNLYWKICFKYLTPCFSIYLLLIAVISNSEPVLNDYHYPKWAHYMGYIICIICLTPIVIYFFKELNKAGLSKVFREASQPSKNWKPAFDDPKQQQEYENSNDSNSSVNQAWIADSARTFSL